MSASSIFLCTVINFLALISPSIKLIKYRLSSNLNAPNASSVLDFDKSVLNVVKGIYYTLSKMGLQVYLDCIVDVDLKRNETNKDTAKRLQKRLMSSKSLIYAQSPEAGRSNWMPWELGVVDGHTGKCMIMPVTKDAQHASPQREYLLLYPYIMPYGIEGQMRVFTESYPYSGEDLSSYIRK